LFFQILSFIIIPVVGAGSGPYNRNYNETQNLKKQHTLGSNVL